MFAIFFILNRRLRYKKRGKRISSNCSAIGGWGTLGVILDQYYIRLSEIAVNDFSFLKIYFIKISIYKYAMNIEVAQIRDVLL